MFDNVRNFFSNMFGNDDMIARREVRATSDELYRHGDAELFRQDHNTILETVRKKRRLERRSTETGTAAVSYSDPLWMPIARVDVTVSSPEIVPIESFGGGGGFSGAGGGTSFGNENEVSTHYSGTNDYSSSSSDSSGYSGSNDSSSSSDSSSSDSSSSSSD